MAQSSKHSELGQLVRANYRTKHEDHQTWLDMIFESRAGLKIGDGPLGSLGVSFVLAAVPYLIGLILSNLWSLGSTYVATSAIYLGVAGIVLTCTVLHIASRNIHEVFADFRLCALISDFEYRRELDRHFDYLSDRKHSLAASSVASVLLVTFAVVAIFYAEHFVQRGITAFRPFLVPLEWFELGNRIPALIVFSVWAICVGLPLGTAYRLMALNFRLLNFIKHLRVFPEPELVRNQMDGLSNFYTSAAVTWFLGVALFGALFFNTIDAVSIAIILVLGSQGIVMFFAPQLVFHKLLVDSHRQKSHHYIKAGLSQMNFSTAVRSPRGRVAPDPRRIEQMLTHIKVPRLWVLDFGAVVTILVGQALALTSPLFESVLKSFFS